MTSLKNVLRKFLNNHYFLILVGFFALFFVIKSYISLFFSSPFNFGDEAVYEIQARSFFNDNFQIQSGYPIGYPLVLSLAYHLSSDKFVIYHVMLIINSLLVTSIVFPVFFILKKYCDNLYSIVGAIVISCLPAINVYSFMLMSENLFIPLFYFALWFLLESIDSDKKYWQILAGFSIVALFFIRSTGIAMVSGFLLLFLILSSLEIKNKSFLYFMTKKIYLLFSGLFTLSLGLLYYYVNDLNLISYSNEGYFSVLISNFSSMDGLVDICLASIHELQYIIISLNFFTILIIGFFSILIFHTQGFANTALNKENEVDINLRSYSFFSLKVLVIFFFFVSVFTIIITITHMLGLAQIYNLPSNYSILGRYIDPIVPGIYLFGLIGLNLILTTKNVYQKILPSLVFMNFFIFCFFIITNPLLHYNPTNIYPILYLERIFSIVPLIVFALFGILFSSGISYIVIKKRFIYLLYFFILLCVLFSSYYVISIELLHSNHAGQFSDIGSFFEKIQEKNVYIFWDIGDNSPLEQIQFFITQFWCKYPLIQFSAHDEISGELKERLRGADFLISTQSIEFPEMGSFKSGYKLYKVSPDPIQKQSLLFINRIEGNWNNLERDENGEFFRWFSTDATIWVYSDSEREATLSFEARSLEEERYLVVNSPKLQTHEVYNIYPQFSKFQYHIKLKKGENDVSLFSSSKIKKETERDSNNITVAIRRTRIE